MTKRAAIDWLVTVVAPLFMALALVRASPLTDDLRVGTWPAVVRILAQPVPLFLLLFLPLSVAGRWGLRQFGHESKSDQRAARSAWWRAALCVVSAGAVSWALRVSVCQPYRVLSGSMRPTLEPRAWLIADKRAYGLRLPGTGLRFGKRLPRRGEVIALQTPASVSGTADELVKRVVGLPGDRITLFRGRLSINGWLVPRCVIEKDAARELGPLVLEYLGGERYLTFAAAEGEPFSGYTVGAGEIFVLGDNRRDSNDSRTWRDGHPAGLPLAAVDGRIVGIAFPSEQHGANPWWQSLSQPVPPLTLSREQRERLTQCLARAPADTDPPTPL